ncbi:MAG TPA: two-component regulator propeller domain-containing protein [Verrucomicrobiae bacterium]|nr:two-component regulator propeller domain-containing protein [Verrucomicrobiae bacterium]
MSFGDTFRCAICLTACAGALASDLPVRVYSTADGLPNNSVNRIVTDSRGFLWFCTSDGAARFDGYQFLTFGVREGLSHRRVNDILESRGGVMWIATGGGLCRLGTRPRPAPAIESEHTPPGTRWITRLLEPRSSTSANPSIWCGTDLGLFRFTLPDGKFRQVMPGSPFIYDLFEDRDGVLWVGTDQGLYRLREDGKADRYTVGQGLPANEVTAVRQDRTGAIWVGTFLGAARLRDGRAELVLNRKSGLAAEYLYAILPLENGNLWLAGTGGVTVVNSAGSIQRKIIGADGLVVDDIEALALDASGNVWVGTDGAGAAKIAQSGFATYSHKDGIEGRPSAILESRAGDLVLITKTDEKLGVYVRRGERFHLVRALASRQKFGWGAGQIAIEGTEHDWWIASGGLFRFAAAPAAVDLAVRAPQMMDTGVPGALPLKVFEDSRGDVWLAFRRPDPQGLARWSRHTKSLEAIVPDSGSETAGSFPFGFAEDRSGGIWIGYFQGKLMRFRDGHLREIVLPARAARGIRALLADSKGRMWVGTSEAGLLRFDDPGAERPAPVSFSGQQGLSGDLIQCLAEDAFGRIYACTGRGVDALDPATGRLRHYTAEDGLVKGDLQIAFRDRDGALWFGSAQGVSRLVPQRDRQAERPYIQISRLEVAGVSQGISPLGQTRVAGLTVPFGGAPLHIEVAGLTFWPGDVLRYQTRLENADRDWNAPTLDRATRYVALQPGSYRFLARAVNAEGLVSAIPAEVEFTVPAPVWRRWWFVSLAALALMGVAWSAHRIRISRLVEIERVRNRIATDLHDDIGSTLSQISVLSEVARRESGPGAHVPIGRISELSRQVLDSMSDIVWAINPARDRPADVIQRMRHFAAELFTAADIDLLFQAGSQAGHGALHLELRRELLLLFKEAANNVVKHSGARHVTVQVSAGRERFVFEIADDGRGFDLAGLSGEGNGLPGIKRRVHALGGMARIESTPGAGTRVRIEVPIRHRRRPT